MAYFSNNELLDAWNEYSAITQTGFDRPGTPTADARKRVRAAIALTQERLKALEGDALTMALRLLGEDESTFSAETAEVMDRWRPLALAALDYHALRDQG